MSNEYKLINGIKIAEKIKDEIVKEIIKLPSRPNLAIILIGDNKESCLYVNIKEREARKVGVDTHLYKCAENISENEILKMIDCLNRDNLIDGILVQLPLPKKFNTDKIIKAISKEKDVDFFHPENLKLLTDKTKNADILISAVGRKHFIKKEMIKEGAALIDVGIVKEDKKIYGDIDAEDVKEKAGFLTPVPGGVGPLTIAMLFQNTLELYKIHKNINHHLLL